MTRTHIVIIVPRPLMVTPNYNPVDNFGTVVGGNQTPYGILALWAVNGLSIVYWEWSDNVCDMCYVTHRDGS